MWGNWSTCSVSCGTGMTSRHRDCTNPIPGPGGKYCIGENIQYNMCIPMACAGMWILYRCTEAIQSIWYQGVCIKHKTLYSIYIQKLVFFRHKIISEYFIAYVTDGNIFSIKDVDRIPPPKTNHSIAPPPSMLNIRPLTSHNSTSKHLYLMFVKVY